ncbi:E3 ubiquitin-protein ligase Topors-like [Hemicordylus capensis]|uniref:E3 ubiquitin-protein ligase Topors-like n=1 Tax=Hemicordylus capensis TaxID=884348 RepID=UPI002304867C|nr:E3 ubiquitin-protein ligase Topors-like [Hemicordylus capensis]
MASETDESSARSSPNRLHQSTLVDASPDSKCPICLDQFENVASLDSCFHRFCFRCVQEWSNTKAECPLCKKPFQTILHNISSEDQYEIYIVDDAFASPHGERTTPTRESDTSIDPLSSSSRTSSTVFPSNEGILFERLLSLPASHRYSEMLPMIRSLASREQDNLEGISPRQTPQWERINFRRALYHSGVRVRNISDGGHYRDISARYFRSDPASLCRLDPWVRRELTVLFGARESLVSIVQRVIMSKITRTDMESQAFAEYLKPFLLHCTEHFLHEFISFASCPFDIELYDQHANYDCPAPSYEEGRPPEIITISSDEADSQQPDRNAFTVGIGQAPWDDETPGPSYCSSEQVCATISAALDTSESSDEEPSENTIEPPRQFPASVETNGVSGDSSHNCVSVGNVKPVTERTPGPFELSSDSEASAEGGKSEEVKQVQPIQCHHFSNTKASRYTSAFFVGSRDDRYNYKSLSNKLKPKRREQDHTQKRESTNQTLSQSSPTKSDDDDGYRISRKRKSEVQDSHSREWHGLKRKRTHHSWEKQKKKRDRSGCKHRKDKKKSRNRDNSLSQKSQIHFPSGESVMSRDPSTSRSCSSESRKRSSQSKGNNYCHRNRTPDGYESRGQSSSRSRIPASGSERTRSEKPSGKRKSKTHHLESTHRGNEDISSSKEERALQKPLLKYCESSKKTAGFAGGQPETEIRYKKGQKRSRSPTVEGISKGKATDARHHKKKRKRVGITQEIHTGNSQFSSPVVIIIDNDSDKDPEIQDNIDCDSSISWSAVMQQNDRETGIPSPVLEARD